MKGPPLIANSLIQEHLYNELYKKAQENKQLTVNKSETGYSLRASDLKGTGERSVSNEPQSIEEFYKLFNYILSKADENDGTNYNLNVTEESPTDQNLDTTVPAMTFRLIRMTPANREIRPRLIEQYSDPDHPGDILEVFRRSQNCTIEVTISTRTNKSANTIVSWVEDKFFEYLWVFEWKGFHKANFIGREEDKTESIKGQLIHKRMLRFTVETCRITKARSAKIKKIILDLSVDKPNSDDLMDR